MEDATAKVGTNHRDLFAALAEPFGRSEVSTRTGAGGKTLSYITARNVMNRFDSVVGPENWRASYRVEAIPSWGVAVVCTIEVRVGGEWIAKEDAGGFKEMLERKARDEENTVKTGFSDALKRSACMWGVGRELYNDGVADFGPDPEPPAHAAGRPPLPAELEPLRHSAVHKKAGSGAPHVEDDDAPMNSSDLSLWCRDQQERTGRNVLQWVHKWGERRGYKGWITKWTADQLREGYHAAVAKLASVEAESQEEALSN